MAGKLTLILGGARSGKSRHAEELAAEVGGDVLFVASAQALDAEMRERIEAHQAARPSGWRTLEAATEVGQQIQQAEPAPAVVVLDCITLLANNMFSQLESDDPRSLRTGGENLEHEIDALLQAHRASEAEWIVISNEVGLGLVPAYPLGRVYRDALGRANQRLAAAADEVLFMVAGLPMVVKSEG